MNLFELASLRCASSLRKLFGLVLSLAVLSLPSLAQVNTGRISGAVTDQSGGRVVGAKVTVTETATGVPRDLVTDMAGEYAAPNLNPGVYSVRVEYMGFQTFERQNVEVGVGGDLHVDVTLQPGQTAQVITVTEALPVINTTNAQTGGTLSNSLLTSIPIGGRNYRWQQELVPGVLIKPGHGTAALDANGTSDGHGGNNILDGVYLQTFYAGEITFGGGGEAGDTTILPLDAIQEVNLVVNPKAEYGYIPGVTASVGLKSGTNNLHGNLYAFGRDSVFDARNAFAAQKTPLAFEQWGATAGGPIKKDKLFYFLGYESFRENFSAVVSDPIPVLFDQDAGGAPKNTSTSIPDAIADIINKHNAATPPAGTTVLNNLSLNIAGCNSASLAGLTGTAVKGADVVATGACNANQFGAQGLWNNPNLGILPNIGRSDNGIAKIDYHLNDRHTINGAYGRGEYEEQAAGNSAAKIAQTYWGEILGHKAQMSRLDWIWTPNSTFLNEARWGLDQNSRPVGRAECTPQADPFSNPLGLNGATTGNYGGPDYVNQYGMLSGAPACGSPTIVLSGGLTQLGFSNSRENNETNVSGNDVASWTHGTHQFKFGVEVRAGHWVGSKSQDALNGVVNFGQSGVAAFKGATALESFLTGVPSSETIRAGIPVRDISQKFIALFAQDDWRIRPRLTLNLGFRQEIMTSPVSTAANLGSIALVPSASNITGVIAKTRPWNNLYEPEPRFGLAWDITGKGTTTLRTGAGIEYGIPTLQSNIGGGGSSATSFDLSTDPTGETIFLQNGSTVTAPGTGASAVETLNPVVSGGVVNTATTPIIWPLNSQNSKTTALFNPIAQCGNGLPQVAPGNPAITNPSPCAVQGNDQNMAFYRFIFWNVNFQHAFTNNLSIDVGYVGSKSTGIILVYDLDQPSPDANVLDANGASEQLRTQYEATYPWFSNIRFNSNSGVDNYRALQLILNERASHGLTFNFAYTFAGNYLTQTTPNYNAGLPRVFGDNLYPRHRFSLTATYELPGIKSPAQLLQGWAVNTAISVESPLPVSVTDTRDDLAGAGTGSGIPWNLYGSPDNFNRLFGRAGNIPCFGVSGVTTSQLKNAPCTLVAPGATNSWDNMPAPCIAAAKAEAPSPGSSGTSTQLTQLSTIGCYMYNGSAMVPPAQGTYGTMVPFELHGPGEGIVNASVTKDWKIKERYSAEFRFEVFNLFNRTQYSGAGVNLGSPSTLGLATSTPDVNTGAGIFGNGGPRDIQFGLKLGF